MDNEKCMDLCKRIYIYNNFIIIVLLSLLQVKVKSMLWEVFLSIS